MVPIAYGRRDDGTFEWVRVRVYSPGGEERVYTLRGSQMSRDGLDALWLAIQGAGAHWAHNPSVNLFKSRLSGMDDDDELDDVDLELDELDAELDDLEDEAG